MLKFTSRDAAEKFAADYPHDVCDSFVKEVNGIFEIRRFLDGVEVGYADEVCRAEDGTIVVLDYIYESRSKEVLAARGIKLR